MSGRTLQRRLSDHATSYRRLVASVLRREAERRLADPAVDVAEVARQLGFSDPGNFSRAFRRWAGVSPKQFRQQTIRANRTQGEIR